MCVIRFRRSFMAVVDALVMTDYHSDRAICEMVAGDVMTWPAWDAMSEAVRITVDGCNAASDAMGMCLHPRWG